MNEQSKIHVERLIQSIRARGQKLDALTQELRSPEALAAFNKWDHDSWCHSVSGDALIRIRLFTEQNFNFVETMSVVAVARYLLELSVWLALFKLDARYGLVYFHRLIETQRRFYRDMRAQLEREVKLLKSFGEKEDQMHEEALNKLKALPPEDISSHKPGLVLKEISDAIDSEASRRFSLYANLARVNGYECQAQLISTNHLPKVHAALAGVEVEAKAFEVQVAQDVKNLIPRDKSGRAEWKWRTMAQKVGMVDEYDYVYSFSSKLLHAEPVSITTDSKTLHLEEFEMFLKYIDVKIADVIVLAEKYCET